MNVSLPVGVTLAITLGLAVCDWVTVARGWRKAEYFFKPATMLALILVAGLLSTQTTHAWAALFFLPALGLSLAGDVFLMLPGEGFFLPGLVAFLAAHICYSLGLNPALPPWPAALLLLPIVAAGTWLYRSIRAGLQRSGRHSLQWPILVYTAVISFMLLSAWATWFRPQAGVLFPLLLGLGASLFYLSDAMLAWNRFVRPSPGARLRVMIAYHVGQILLVAALAAG